MKTPIHASLLALALTALTPAAFAKDIRLPAQRASICVGKSGVVMRTKTQLQELVVNGITSPNSTFNVRIRHANLTCDFDTAESIVAHCLTPGRQVIDTQVKFAYADPNRYLVQIAIDCRICPGGGGAGGGGGGGGGAEPIPHPKPKPVPPREER